MCAIIIYHSYKMSSDIIIVLPKISFSDIESFVFPI